MSFSRLYTATRFVLPVPDCDDDCLPAVGRTRQASLDEAIRAIVANPASLSIRVLQAINCVVALQKEYGNMVCYDSHGLLLALLVVHFPYEHRG